jgi:hypothetical protein
MSRESMQFLNVVQYAAMAVGVLTLTGIASLMFLARGTGEDINGIVAPAALIAIVSGVVALVAWTTRKRALKTLLANREHSTD